VAQPAGTPTSWPADIH